MGPSGIIALLAGWFTTEIGRQPWVIQGLMRTADASSGHSFAQMSLTLGLFVVVYFTLFGVGISYMLRLVRKGPVTNEGLEPGSGGPGQQRTPARPLSAADEDLHDAVPHAQQSYAQQSGEQHGRHVGGQFAAGHGPGEHLGERN